MLTAYCEAMNKNELARRLARLSHRSRAKAADEVDTLVYQILKNLKRRPAKSVDEHSLVVGALLPKEKQ